MCDAAALAPVRRLAGRDDGQDLIEYGLLTSLIALFVMGGVRLLGDQISGVLWAFIARGF